jgi:MFS family permease
MASEKKSTEPQAEQSVLKNDESRTKSSSIEVQTEGDNTGDRPRRSWRFIIAFVFLFLCAFISAIDATILGTALAPITEELNGTSILAFWCATSFFLSKTVVQPGNLPHPALPREKRPSLLIVVWGNLSEIFGRKYIILSAILIFLGGSIASSRSMSLETLIAGRTLQGIGGGGLVTMVEVVITDMVPLAERGGYFSILALVWTFGSVVGTFLSFS